MQTPNNENDYCVCCGADTGVLSSTPIAKRKYYITGSGQLCENCYVELYITKAEEEKTVSLDEMNRLIQMCKKNNDR